MPPFLHPLLAAGKALAEQLAEQVEAQVRPPAAALVKLVAPVQQQSESAERPHAVQQALGVLQVQP